uniref:C2H2-type domain-containing protein n=2 Tax=Amphimedon queenslandica TaxID=400682 RepID=A0A1X7V2N3_AMPQE
MDLNLQLQCRVTGCTQSFTKYCSILSHISRHHGGLNSIDEKDIFGTVGEEIEGGTVDLNEQSSNSIDEPLTADQFQEELEPLALPEASTGLTGTHHIEMVESTASLRCEEYQIKSALFLLRLEERYRVTQVGIDFTVNQVRSINATIMNDVKASVLSLVDENNRSSIEDCFDDVNPFKHLETSYLQNKFFKEKMNYVIVQTHSHTDGFIADYCDGDLFRSHNLFCEKPNSLQIILYFDEIEVCNPLGAHSGLQKLGIETTLHGSVLLALADTLAAHQLGGFKVGVGFAFSKCRDCFINEDDIAFKVLSETVSCALKEDNHAKLAKFVEYFDHFFDCLNVTSISGGKHKLKKYSYPYRTANDDRLKWLAVDFMGYLDDWSKSVMERDGFSEEEKKKMSYSQQTIEGIQRTGQSLAESVDDHESQSTLVVDTATVDVQSIVAHSPSPYSSTSSTNTTTSILLPLQKSVLELDHPLLYYNNLRYQKIALKRSLQEEVTLRTPENYEEHYLLIKSSDRISASRASVTYGINYRSVLDKIKGFLMANCQIPLDIMHVIIEVTIYPMASETKQWRGKHLGSRKQNLPKRELANDDIRPTKTALKAKTTNELKGEVECDKTKGELKVAPT